MLDALFSEELTVRDKLEAHINKTEIAYKADHNLDRASKRVFKLFKKALADFSESNRGYNAYNVSGEGVERYALPDGKTNVDPRSVTEEDVRTLLERAYKKGYKDKTYLPIRVITPYVMIYAGGNYQALITAYPFDSNDIQNLINNKNNLILYPSKKKGTSQRGIGHPVPSHLNESPFAISIPNPAEEINPLGENSSKKFSKPKMSTEGGRASVTSNRTYSYNELVAKDPIPVIDIADTVPLTADLVAFAQNKNGSYLVRFVVDKNTNTVSSITSFVLGAAGANKNGALILSRQSQTNSAIPKGNEAVEDKSRTPYLNSATISIADLLNLVKNNILANEVFPKTWRKS